MQYLKIKNMILFFSLLPMLAGCAGGLTTFNQAQKLERQGKLDEAVLKYAEISAAQPDVSEYRVRFLRTSEMAARVHFKKGEEYLAGQKYDDALREYQTAFTLDPSLERASQMIDQATKLRNSGKFLKEGEEFEKNRKMREALTAYKKTLEFDPGNSEAKEAVERLIKSRKSKLDGYELNLKSTKPITLKFRDAKIKEVFNILSQLSGINFVFDEGMKDQNITVFLENATFQQALEILTGMNKLGKKVLNESTIIVYPKTPEKNKQYEELMVQTFQLNKLDAKKAVNLVRTMLPAKKIYVNEDMNALVIRDTPEAIEVVRKILEANDIPDAELVLDVEVMEITKSNADNLGLVLSKYAVSGQLFKNGTAISDTLGGVTTSGTGTTTATTINNLVQAFQWGPYSGFMTVPSATYNFAKTLANGQTLANPRIRVKNREKSKFNVGTRVPITSTSSPTGGGTMVNVQYIDVGVKVNAEPTIQLNDDINIKLSLEVSSVINRQTVGDASSLTTVVTIGTRNLDTVLSLKDGETSIIGGLIQDNKSDSKQTFSILGDIPILGPLLTGTNKTNDKTELILAITPHIVRAITAPDADVASFWSGKEDEPSVANPYASFVQEPDIPSPQPAVPASPTPQGRPAVSAPPAGSANPTMPDSPAGSINPAVLAPPAGTAPPAIPAAPGGSTNPGLPVPPAGSSAIGGPAVAVAPQSASAPNAPAKVSLNINAPSAVALNDQFSIDIVASNLVNLSNAPFVISYDPVFLDYVGAREGPFLKSDGKPTSFQATGVKDSGQIAVDLSRADNSVGVKGTGTLATLTFKAKRKGTANLGLLKASFTDPEGKPLDVVPFNTVVEVK
jgi:general secretion pathway protein D